MSSKYDTYNNPLTGRYAGKEMSRIWSPQYKHSTWRRLWLALAENEKIFCFEPRAHDRILLVVARKIEKRDLG